jgi:hypothetical protein
MQIPIGNKRIRQKFTGAGRSPAQIAVVTRIAASAEFDFACIIPDWKVGRRPCSFAFTWYDKRDVLHITWITPTGRYSDVRSMRR